LYQLSTFARNNGGVWILSENRVSFVRAIVICYPNDIRRSRFRFVGAQHSVSRRKAFNSISYSTLDVCDSRDLSDKPTFESVAMVDWHQPNRRAPGNFPLGAPRHAARALAPLIGLACVRSYFDA
jgi:hypothetical protein